MQDPKQRTSGRFCGTRDRSVTLLQVAVLSLSEKGYRGASGAKSPLRRVLPSRRKRTIQLISFTAATVKKPRKDCQYSPNDRPFREFPMCRRVLRTMRSKYSAEMRNGQSTRTGTAASSGRLDSTINKLRAPHPRVTIFILLFVRIVKIKRFEIRIVQCRRTTCRQASATQTAIEPPLCANVCCGTRICTTRTLLLVILV